MFSDNVLIDKGYKLTAKLGKWDLGEEFCAIELATGAELIIKAVSSEYAEFHKLISEQFNLNCHLNHPNIAASHEIIIAGKNAYIVTELYSAKTLGDYITEAQKQPLNVRSIGECLNPLIDALTFAHAAGVIHANIKPDKIRLGIDGRWKIIDFGYGQILAQYKKHRMGRRMAMKASDELYKAPEILKGFKYGPKADVYSLGLISFQLFGGNFPSFSIKQMVAMKWDWERPFTDLPIINSKEIEQVLLQATLNDPDRRLQSLAGFVSALN